MLWGSLVTKVVQYLLSHVAAGGTSGDCQRDWFLAVGGKVMGVWTSVLVHILGWVDLEALTNSRVVWAEETMTCCDIQWSAVQVQRRRETGA